MTRARDAPIQHVENERSYHQHPRSINRARPRLAHVVHGTEDRRGTAAAVGEGEEIGQMKISNHREVTRTPVRRIHGGDVTRCSRPCPCRGSAGCPPLVLFRLPIALHTSTGLRRHAANGTYGAEQGDAPAAETWSSTWWLMPFVGGSRTRHQDRCAATRSGPAWCSLSDPLAGAPRTAR